MELPDQVFRKHKSKVACDCQVFNFLPFSFAGERNIAIGSFLRWLIRVMQDHEARASDLNRKLINILVLFAIFLIKAIET